MIHKVLNASAELPTLALGNPVTRVSDMSGGRVDLIQTSSSLLLFSIYLTAVTTMALGFKR